MSEENTKEVNERMNTIQKLNRAPSQQKIFLHLLGTGRTMTVKEISGELGMTSKATERGVAKLVEKSLIQKASFRQAAYSCDSKQIVLGLLLAVMELREKLKKKGI
jgi:predicted transcriptional regulator